jgi:Flp pilus assembly protein TadG
VPTIIARILDPSSGPATRPRRGPRLGPIVRAWRDERGAAAIEAAAALPFLVALGAGLFELGGAFYNYELMQTGVRDGARYLARVADPAAAAAVTAAKNLAVTGTIGATAPARVKGWQTSQLQVTYVQTANPADGTTGLRQYRGGSNLTTVHVASAMPYAGLGLLGAFNLGAITIRAAHEERYVGW